MGRVGGDVVSYMPYPTYHLPSPITQDKLADGLEVAAELWVVGEVGRDLLGAVHHRGVVASAQQPADLGG